MTEPRHPHVSIELYDEKEIDDYIKDDVGDESSLLDKDFPPLPRRNTDPCRCFCVCNFRRLGQSYVCPMPHY